MLDGVEDEDEEENEGVQEKLMASYCIVSCDVNKEGFWLDI